MIDPSSNPNLYAVVHDPQPVAVSGQGESFVCGTVCASIRVADFLATVSDRAETGNRPGRLLPATYRCFADKVPGQGRLTPLSDLRVLPRSQVTASHLSFLP
jgi:hypothetical protein